MRLFFLRPGALGDTLLCAPALAAARARWPGSHVALAGQSAAVDLLLAAGLVDLGLSHDDARLTPLFGTSGDVASARFLLGDVSVAVAWLADAEGIVGGSLRRLGAQQVIVAPSVPPPEAGIHVADHLVATLAGLGVAPLAEPLAPLLVAPADAQDWADGFLGAARARPLPLVVLHPGSGGRRKNWHAAGFAAVAALLRQDHEVVVLAGPADADAVAALLAGAESPFILASDLTLRQVAALLARAGAFLGNDSGVSHLAGLLGVPTVALFGPTEPRLWRPRGPAVTVLRWAAGPHSLAAAEVAATVAAVCRRP